MRETTISVVIVLGVTLYSQGFAGSAACVPKLQIEQATATTLLFANPCNETQNTEIIFQYRKVSDEVWTPVNEPRGDFYQLSKLDPDTQYIARLVTSNKSIAEVTTSTCKERPSPVRKQVQEKREGNVIAFSVESPLTYKQCKRFYKLRYQPEGNNFTEWYIFCYEGGNGNSNQTSMDRCGTTIKFLLRKNIEAGKHHNIEIQTVRLGAENETSDVFKFRAFVPPVGAINRTSQGRNIDFESTIANGVWQNTTQPGYVNDASARGNPKPQSAPRNKPTAATEVTQDTPHDGAVTGIEWIAVIVTSAVVMAIVALPMVRCFNKRQKFNFNHASGSIYCQDGLSEGTRTLANKGTKGGVHVLPSSTSTAAYNDTLKQRLLESQKRISMSPSEIEYDVVYAHLHPGPARLEFGATPKTATIHRGTYRRNRPENNKNGGNAPYSKDVVYENTLKKHHAKVNPNFTGNESQSVGPKMQPEGSDDHDVEYENTAQSKRIYMKGTETCYSEYQEVSYENIFKGKLPPSDRLESPSTSVDTPIFPLSEVHVMIQDEASSFVYLNMSNLNPTTEDDSGQVYENIDKARQY